MIHYTQIPTNKWFSPGGKTSPAKVYSRQNTSGSTSTPLTENNNVFFSGSQTVSSTGSRSWEVTIMVFPFLKKHIPR